MLGAVVHADLPGPATQGHVHPSDHPHRAGAQPTLCKAAGEHALREATSGSQTLNARERGKARNC